MFSRIVSYLLNSGNVDTPKVKQKDMAALLVNDEIELLKLKYEKLQYIEEKEKERDKTVENKASMFIGSTSIMGAINRNVSCDVDKKTSVITIEVTDQDPLIAATIADSVKVRLQDFITEYRTKKVKVDMEYNRKLFQEAKERYEKARQRYASFSDANQDLILQSVRTRLTDLENDMQLQYNAYSRLAAQ